MLRRLPRLSRPIVLGALVLSSTAVAAVAGTVHAFAVSQTTGSEGAYDFLQTTIPGGALQGEVGAAASTALGTPFGIFGKYGPSGTKTLGLGVVGISSQGWGVTGESLNGYPALYGFANAKGGAGLDAESEGDYQAIYGEAHASGNGAEIYADGSGVGVYAYSTGAGGMYAEGGTGDGIDAYSDDSTNGVFGSSGGGYGVQGYSTSSDGVHAEISNASSGVAGINDAAGNGVYGQSNTGIGVNAESLAIPSAVPTGALYQYAATYSSSQSGPGVYGVDAHDTGTAVAFTSAYDRYTGMSGYGYDGAGIYGYSKNDIGAIAESSSSNHNAPALLVEQDTTSGGDEIDAGAGGVAADTLNFTVNSAGDEYVAGNITSGAGVFTVTRNASTDTVAYGPASTEPTMEDVGSAHLVNGTAAVALADDFRQTIQDPAHYMVFLTPYGDAGLYVASRTASGFVVRELYGGHSTMDFDYKIVAKRYGVQTGRLPHLATIAPRMAALRFAALHRTTTAVYANTPPRYAIVAPPIHEASKRAALLAQARHVSAAAHRRTTRPPAPPPGFLDVLHH